VVETAGCSNSIFDAHVLKHVVLSLVIVCHDVYNLENYYSTFLRFISIVESRSRNE